MEEEKLLPQGEPGIEITALPVTRTPAEPGVTSDETPGKPVEPVANPISLPGEPSITSEVIPGVPSQQQQQWGVIISIVVIVLMIVVGAFYAWGQRIAQNQYPAAVTE